MRALASDDEQLVFWRRHLQSGVALCVVVPAVMVLRTLTTPSAPHALEVLALALSTAVLAPLLLLVPVAAVVRHRCGRLFFDAWEVVGIALVCTGAALDGGVGSPYALFLYVLLAHAALAYPPGGVVLAGSAVVSGYAVVGAVVGPAAPQDLAAGVLALVIATGTCAFASANHVRLYRRTAAYARQIAVLAETDGLTGCLNHRAFHQRLQAEATRAGARSPLALLLVDVDAFKAVNDTHGHPAGDAALQLVARVLTDCSRAGDAVGRLGGDEFALLLPATDLPDAVAVAERVRASVREGATAWGATVSVGAAVLTERGGAAAVLAAADRAVYRAKRSGRDAVATAGSSPATALPEPLAL